MARALQQLVGWGGIHVMGLMHGSEFLGTVSVVTAPGVAIANPGLVEAFATQAAVAIERKQSQDKLRETEEQLVQSQKLEAIGRLAGGLAHDFNNLLAVIMASANLLKLKAGAQQELVQHAQLIETEAQRGSELVQQLLGFARKGKLDRMSVDVHLVIDEVASMLEHTVDPSIVITRDLQAEASVVHGDPGQLQQVLLNLAVNARDAMPDGGSLVLSTRTVLVDERSSRIRRPLASGQYLVASVSDTGSGIPDDLKSRIYEPFFTTKEPGSGTGMGLATSYGIVKRHGGLLDLESEEGAGSTFHVWLPVLTGEPPAMRNAAAPEALPRGSGRVLVVDDQAAVCQVLAGMLTTLGYQVQIVHNGQDALDYYREHGATLNLVILDLKMPVMDGAKAFRMLRQLDPEVRVLISSGHAAGHLIDELLRAGARGCLLKPYSLRQLAEAVASALAP